MYMYFRMYTCKIIKCILHLSLYVHVHTHLHVCNGVHVFQYFISVNLCKYTCILHVRMYVCMYMYLVKKHVTVKDIEDVLNHEGGIKMSLSKAHPPQRRYVLADIIINYLSHSF